MLEISTSPLANGSAKRIRQVQIVNHSPSWRVWFSFLGYNYLAKFLFSFYKETFWYITIAWNQWLLSESLTSHGRGIKATVQPRKKLQIEEVCPKLLIILRFNFVKGELINMTRIWDKEKIWVLNRNQTHDLPNTGLRSYWELIESKVI